MPCSPFSPSERRSPFGATSWGGAGRPPGPGGARRAAAPAPLRALCVSVVAALAAWLGPGMGGDDGYDGAQARRFRIFGNLFTFTMLFAVTSNNVGFMWIAIEATTITP